MRNMEQTANPMDYSERLVGDSRFSCNICLETVSDEPVLTLCGHVYCWACLFQWLKPGLTLSEQTELGLAHAATISSDASRRVCPTCKSSCSVRHVIPIYVRGAEDDEDEVKEDDVPERRGSEDDVAVGDDSLVTDLNITEGGLRHRNRSVHAEVRTNSEHGQVQVNRDERVIPRRESLVSPSGNNSRLVNDRIPRRPRLTERTEVRLSPQLYPSASLSHGMFPLPRDPAADDGATEYLSRLLLLLGSFVILCLLVFP